MNGKEAMRNNADMLIVHATLPGHVAFRDKITGSWFIQILCEVFMNYSHKTHLEDLLHMVNTLLNHIITPFPPFPSLYICYNIDVTNDLQVDERLKIQRTTNDECQTLMVTSIGFNKHCYLNPGLFENT